VQLILILYMFMIKRMQGVTLDIPPIVTPVWLITLADNIIYGTSIP
jgi:hypothetical protein